MNAPLDIRLPPHSIEAEQHVIGALLIDGRAFDRVCDVVAESDFYSDCHRRVFRHVAQIVEQRRTVDFVCVVDALKLANELDQAGGMSYLGEIATSVPSAANVAAHARIVAEKARMRRLIEAGTQIAELGWSTNPPDEAIAEAQGLLLPLANTGRSRSGPRSIADVLGRTVEQVEQNYASGGALKGLQTGFADLDRRIGGLRSGDMCVIAGRPGSGKTTLAMNMATNVAQAGGKVMVFSLEMGDTQLAQRALASIGSIELERLRHGRLKEDDFDRMAVALGKLHSCALEIDETAGLTIAQLNARARRVAHRLGGLDLILIDYLQLVAPAKSAGTRNDEVAAISAGVKALAKDIGCPVVVLAQLSRKVEERADKRPLLSDLRDSGAIEQDADMVLMLYRDEYYNLDSPDKGIAEVNVAKHRHGEPGIERLGFQGVFSRFTDLDGASVAAAVERRQNISKPASPRRKGFNYDN